MYTLVRDPHVCYEYICNAVLIPTAYIHVYSRSTISYIPASPPH
jgi:hypothetical protein